MKAGIYARISRDSDGDGLGVERQIADCTREAERRGWKVAETYTDNDVSATRAKSRPQYERMMQDVRDKRIKALVVWDVDRLTRTPRELEDIIDLADDYGLKLANVGGEVDLSSPQGRMTARIKGSVARHETDQQSRRLKRRFQQKAEKGEPHGFAPYGYRRIVNHDAEGKRVGATQVVVPEHAAVIREAANRILIGESLRSIIVDFNQRGIPGPRAPRWNGTILRQILQRATNAGLRTYRGQIVGQGNWEAIYDQDTHTRLVALLSDPERRTNERGSNRRHVLSGLIGCGVCGALGSVVVSLAQDVTTKRGTPTTRPPAYYCRACTRVRRLKSVVDDVVFGVVIARLERPDALDAMASGDPGALDEARQQVKALEARITEAADLFAEGTITADDLRRVRAKIQPKLDRQQAIVNHSMPNGALAELAGPDAAKRWEAAPLDVKRMVIAALMSITLLPIGRGRKPGPESIQIRWK